MHGAERDQPVYDRIRDADALELRETIPFTTTPSSGTGHDRVVGELLLEELDRLDGIPPIIYGVDDRVSVELDRYREMMAEDEFYIVAKEAEYGDTDGDIDIGVFHVDGPDVTAKYVEAKSYPVAHPASATTDQIDTFRDHAAEQGWDVDIELAFYDDESRCIYRCGYEP